MKQATKRFVSLLLGFLFLVLAFAVYYLFTRPAYDDIKTLRSDLYSRRNFIDSQQAAISQVQKLIDSYQGEAELQQAINRALPLTPDVATALAQVDGLIRVNGLILQSISISMPPLARLTPGTGGESPDLVKPRASFTMQVRAAGSYENMKSFLGNIETNIRILEVKNFGIQPVQETGTNRASGNLYNYDMAIVAYYQPSYH